jgi:membrane protease YdiL (CAAX protease family)
VVVLLAGVFVLAIAVTILRSPEGVIVSADPGHVPRPVPLLLVPTLAAIVLTMLLPQGEGGAGAAVRRPRAVRVETGLLLTAVLAFPLLLTLLPQPEAYVLLKVALFLVLAPLLLGLSARRAGPSVAVDRPTTRPWPLLLPPLVLAGLSTLGPFSAGAPSVWPPPAVLLVAAVGTATTAGLGEELMYRRFLQTRLESLTGSWTGLLLASLLFGLMHATSHGEGPLWASAAQAVAMQGTTGIALGMMWRRWRRLWVCVLGHVLLNGLVVLLHLLGLIG